MGVSIYDDCQPSAAPLVVTGGTGWSSDFSGRGGECESGLVKGGTTALKSIPFHLERSLTNLSRQLHCNNR